MVGSKVLLLLFGTTIASCHFLRHALNGDGLNHVPLVHSTPGGLSQFMPHLLPSGGNVFYKPQFIIPSMIERIVRAKIDCVKDGLEHFLPVIPDVVVQKPVQPKEFTVIVPPEPEVVIENKPIQIPDAPMLPPFTMPELPIFVEEPKTKIDCEKDGLKHYVPVLPDIVVQKPVQPNEFTVIVPSEPEVVIENKPIEIPEPPVLPPFTMPELPIFVEEQQNNQEKKDNCKPLEIPVPPVLPKMPELPIPQNVDIFTDNFPTVPVISGFEPLPAPEFIPIEIPEPPTLPPISIPELPVPVFTEVIPENRPVISPESPILLPLPVPEGPTLPPFVLPPLPEIVVEEKRPEVIEHLFKPFEGPQIIPQPSEPPKPENAPNNCIDDVPESVQNDNGIPEFQLVAIPEPPILPPFIMSELPALPNIATDNKPEPEPVMQNKPCEIPAPPKLPPLEFPDFPGFEYVSQNIDVNPTEAIQIPPSPVLPPLKIPASLPNIVEEPQVIEVKDIPILPETPPLTLLVPQHPSVTEVIREPCDNTERVPENKPILILEQMHPVTGVTTQEVVPEVMELNVGGTKVTIPSLGSLSFPNFCVQNLIIDRALPSMIIGEKYYAKSMAPYIAKQHSLLPMFQYYKR